MIRIEKLVKTFGAKRAVDDVSFEVARGEVLGFLGPNGAGKSTTMRMITGFIPPTSGSVRVGEHNVSVAPLEAKRLIGYLPEAAPSYPDMTVQGFLEFAADMRGLSGDAKKRAIGAVIERCFLGAVVHQSIETLSKGYRHRTCLAQALIHDPEVLVLDEPTDGLDPNQKHEVRNLIRELGRTKAVVFSTHILEEVDAACTRAIIIDRGRIVANGTPAELRALSAGSGAVGLRLAGDAPTGLRERLAALPGVERVDEGADGMWQVVPRARGEGGAVACAVAQAALEAGWTVDALRTEEGQLDEVFRRITLPDTATRDARPVQARAS